jgi:cyclopropane-fatty-acyl-phospholipid synthase
MSVLSKLRRRRRGAAAEGAPEALPREGRGEAAGRLDRLLRGAVHRRLAGFRGGRLVLREDGRETRFGPAGEAALSAAIDVHDPAFYRHVALGGHLGAAESYIRGQWDCDDLTALLRMFCRDFDTVEHLEHGTARAASWIGRLVYRFRRNTARGSRRNIAAHYDLGDDFFSLFLDPTMAYSCALFPRPDATLEEASREKFDRVCRKLALSPSDHVLEIGSGWGGFAVHAAGRYGCRVTTTTISQRQVEYARALVAERGLTDRVSVLDQDYRRLGGTFDKLVSIEMIEAVGWQYFDAFFGVCSARLKPDGLMLLQAITVPDQRFDRHRRGDDFIQQYIFPGGCLPSLGAICRSLGRATDLRVVGLEDITAHYPPTLAQWRERLRARADEARELGLCDELLRLFEFYFSYCEAGFRERLIGDAQILLAKPAWRGEGY